MLDQNDRVAERNRGFFLARGLLAVNVLSSPGSGKTTFLGETVKRLGTQCPAGVVVGDLATDNDARRLRETGAPAIQITTGTMCHLEAEMVARALKQLDLRGLEFLFIENVGNLVCPAAYDLGEQLRVVLFSVTEGEDKPLKYPPMFHSADCVIISKIDLAGPCAFDRATAYSNLRRAAPRAQVFELSSRTGEGFEVWLNYLAERKRESAEQDLA
jgi:hydrogenase nickel incorporation protein HypB